MRAHSNILVAVAFCIAAVRPTASAGQTTTTCPKPADEPVQVIVTSEHGSAISGAEVRVPALDCVSSTDRAGIAELPAFSDAFWVIAASVGYNPRGVHVSPRRDESQVHVALAVIPWTPECNPACCGPSLRVQLLHGELNSPVYGPVSATLHGDGESHGIATYGDGWVRWWHGDPGSYTLVIDVEGFDPWRKDVVLIGCSEDRELVAQLGPSRAGPTAGRARLTAQWPAKRSR